MQEGPSDEFVFPAERHGDRDLYYSCEVQLTEMDF